MNSQNLNKTYSNDFNLHWIRSYDLRGSDRNYTQLQINKGEPGFIGDTWEATSVLEATSSALGVCALSNLELQQLPNTETFMEERTEPIPHFAVYRQGLTEKIDLLHIGYKTDDPDDREYKRIFAQERVDALNEKP